MRWTPEQARARGFFQRLDGSWVHKTEYADVQISPGPKKPGLSEKHKSKLPSTKRLNNLERRWLAILKERYPSATIIPQFRLRLSEFGAPKAVHYTPDFAVFIRSESATGTWFKCLLFETKDSRRKYHSVELKSPKLVRLAHPWVTAVYLAEWDGEQWTERLLA